MLIASRFDNICKIFHVDTVYASSLPLGYLTTNVLVDAHDIAFIPELCNAIVQQNDSGLAAGVIHHCEGLHTAKQESPESNVQPSKYRLTETLLT
jgi:hypothetical protein